MRERKKKKKGGCYQHEQSKTNSSQEILNQQWKHSTCWNHRLPVSYQKCPKFSGVSLIQGTQNLQRLKLKSFPEFFKEQSNYSNKVVSKQFQGLKLSRNKMLHATSLFICTILLNRKKLKPIYMKISLPCIEFTAMEKFQLASLFYA